jgi:hypothetical protein
LAYIEVLEMSKNATHSADIIVARTVQINPVIRVWPALQLDIIERGAKGIALS